MITRKFIQRLLKSIGGEKWALLRKYSDSDEEKSHQEQRAVHRENNEQLVTTKKRLHQWFANVKTMFINEWTITRTGAIVTPFAGDHRNKSRKSNRKKREKNCRQAESKTNETKKNRQQEQENIHLKESGSGREQSTERNKWTVAFIGVCTFFGNWKPFNRNSICFVFAPLFAPSAAFSLCYHIRLAAWWCVVFIVVTDRTNDMKTAST